MTHGISLQETLTYDTNVPPHWKCVLQHFANFYVLFIPVQKWTSDNTSNCLPINLRVYTLVSQDHHL